MTGETPMVEGLPSKNIKPFPYMPAFEQGWMGEVEVATMVGFARLIPNIIGGVLEVGCWRGRTTAPLSQLGPIDVVDLFEGRSGSVSTVNITDQKERFGINVRDWGKPANVRILQGDSHKILPTLEPESYRFILLDGDHATEAALQDLHDCWRLLAPGGYLFVDDRDFAEVIRAVKKFLDAHPELGRQMGVVTQKLGYFYKEKP